MECFPSFDPNDDLFPLKSFPPLIRLNSEIANADHNLNWGGEGHVHLLDFDNDE